MERDEEVNAKLRAEGWTVELIRFLNFLQHFMCFDIVFTYIENYY